MKNICRIIWFLSVVSLLYGACDYERGLSDSRIPKEDNQRQEEVVMHENDATVKKDEEYDARIVSPEQIWLDTEKVNQMLEELNIKEKFLAVIPVSAETLLLQCKNRENEESAFYALHMKAENEKMQRMELNLVGEVDCYTYEDCIVLYDTMNRVIVLDSELEIRNEILIPDSIHAMWEFMSVRNYCVLPREQKVLYYESVLENGELYVGLYETDYTYEESRLIYKMNGPETNLNFLNGFFEICPGYFQRGIFFTGDYFETIDSQSKKCVGYLDFDAEMPVVCKTNMQQKEVTAEGGVFFDGYRERDSEYSGELLMIDESGAVSRMKTEYYKESERVSCDRKGRMLTCYETDNGETVLNLYNENVWEKQIVIPYNVEDFILLNAGQCILCSYRSQDGLRISIQDI